MSNGNSNLHDSRANKADEFYTQLQTIEDELRNYQDFFFSKSVFCNADDPYESNFFKYFCLNFNRLHLKKLVCTCYQGSPFAGTQLSLFGDEPNEPIKHAYKIVIDSIRGADGSDTITMDDVKRLLLSEDTKPQLLQGTGDFRSPECIQLLRDCDVVCTNPPFSLMGEYLPLMVNSGKKFIVLGNINHALYAENFAYFKENKVWLGYHSGHFWFKVPDNYVPKPTDFRQDEDGTKWRRMGNICWFTNVDIDRRHQPLLLYKHYSPEEFPKYDNFDAIECPKYSDIPVDYDGMIGVPITYLAYHCNDQFEIIGELKHGCDSEFDLGVPTINGKSKYTRIVIRKKQGI